MKLVPLLLLLVVPLAHAFTQQSSPKRVTAQIKAIEDDCDNSSRIISSQSQHHDVQRFLVASTLAITSLFVGGGTTISIHEKNGPITTSSSILMPPAAHALKEKNEVLCNTGFFTNVGAWYCTDIGNIGDEGQSKPMSGESEASVDSLMSKFDLGDGDLNNGKEGFDVNKVGKTNDKGSGDATKK